jgi:hypothetical protein
LTRKLPISVIFRLDKFDPWQIMLVEEFMKVLHEESFILDSKIDYTQPTFKLGCVDHLPCS